MSFTHLQFEALRKLTGMHDGPMSKALRAVLVDGARNVDAAVAQGISTSGVNRRVMECRRKIELAKIVAGMKS